MSPGMPLRKSQTGATFIEVMAAVGVFSLVAVGLSPSLLSARKVADLGKNRSIATTLAADKLENIRTLGAGTLVLDTTGSDGPLNASGGTTGGIFSRSWSIGSGPISGVYLITTTVSWNEHGVGNSVKLVALARAQ